MSLHERAMGVLSCTHVDDVVIGAPFKLNRENIESLNISIIIHGSVSDDYKDDPYEFAKDVCEVKQIESKKKYLTTTFIIERILKNFSAYEERNLKKLNI
jgi:ethanolamine-phosphate cytidylyltransferase